MNSKNLVYLPLSSTNHSMAHCWFGKNKEYDLLINNWGEKDFYKDANHDLYFQIKNHKYKTLLYLFQNFFEIMSKYDYIMCPDPDLKTEVEDINHLFRIVKKYDLALSQPSLTGYYNWECFQHDPNPNIILKHYNYVENMCPVFSIKALYACLWTFSLSYSTWGLEFLWTKLASSDYKKIAVVNSVKIENTRKNESGNIVYPNGKTAWLEYDETIAKFNLDNKPKLMGVTSRFDGQKTVL